MQFLVLLLFILTNAAQADRPVAEKSPEKKLELKPQPVETKVKRKVVLLGYGGPFALKIRKQLISKSCVKELELIEMPYNLQAKEAESKIAALKLPAGSVVIAAGHAIHVDYGDWHEAHPEYENDSPKKQFDVWEKAMLSGKDHMFSVTSKNGVKGMDLRDAIQKAAPEASVWFHSCHSGGVCGNTCMGSSCAADEVTLSSQREPSPPDQALINLLCDPELRRSTDTNHNGMLDNEELKNYFSCDAAKHPFTVTQEFGFDSEKEKKEKLEEAKRSAFFFLRDALTQEDKSDLDAFERKRFERVQESYPELRNITFKEMKDVVSFTEESTKTQLRLIAKLRPPKKAACYWKPYGMKSESMTPQLGGLQIPVTPSHSKE